MARAKFRNDSASTIYLHFYGHQQILAAGVVTLDDDDQPTKFHNDSQLDTLLGTGDLVFIDSLGVDRTYADAKRILNGIQESVISGGSSGQLLCTTSTGDLVWTSIIGGTVAFSNEKKTKDKWLKLFAGEHSEPSNKAPLIIPFASEIYALTFMNKKDNVSCDIEIYKNSSLLFTWNVISKRWAYKTDGLSALTFTIGDRISMFLKKNGQTDSDSPLITIHYSFLNGTTGSGGATTGI